MRTVFALLALFVGASAFAPRAQPRATVSMSAEPQSRRALLGAFGAAIVGTAAVQPSEAYPQPTMTYGQLPVPVYGTFDGKSVGNKYSQLSPQEGKTFVLLPWMKK
mmetsp:Transcript_13528/g.32038  ORF Transcript_13528/g.32038 Transcript_13528/m.32038 type:complete len:106 (+) Transcript_13528:56-373(+)